MYVQQQVGHASVTMTVDTYGSWFAVKAPGAMDRLASQVVTFSAKSVTSLDWAAGPTRPKTLPQHDLQADSASRGSSSTGRRRTNHPSDQPGPTPEAAYKQDTPGGSDGDK